MSFHRSRLRLLLANLFPLVKWRPVEKGKSREPPARPEEGCQRHIFTAIPLQLSELLGALRPSACYKAFRGLWFVITASLPTAWIKAGCLFFHLALSYFCDCGLFYRQGSLTSPTPFWGQGLPEEHWFVLARYNLLRWDFPGSHKSLFCIYHSTVRTSPSVPAYHLETLWSMWNISCLAVFPNVLGWPVFQVSRICPISFTLATDLDTIPG